MNRFGAFAPGQGRDALVAETRRVLDDALPAGARVVVAVSGGPDSTALAYLLTEARPDMEGHVAHIRHGLRGDEHDAAVAAAHAAALGLAYHERAVTVRPASKGPEAAARQARYRALYRLAKSLNARAILVGHTADDQAETVLLNVVRGAGLTGLAGMPSARSEDAEAHGVRVIRPLLRLRRGDVRSFVEGEGLQAVSDPTNRDPEQRRARARHHVLPALASLSGGSGDPVGALTRLADLARADAEALDELAAIEARRAVVAWGPSRAVRSADLAALPLAVAARVLRLMLRGVRGLGELSAAAVADVLDLEPGGARHLPGGVWITCGGGWLAAVPHDLAPLPERSLAVPDARALPELDVVVHVDVAASPTGQGRLDVGAPAEDPAPPGRLAGSPPGARHRLWTLLGVQPDEQLCVRARRRADRLGDVSVGELLRDAGVPRAVRDLVPVVADAHGRARWIPGVAGDAEHPGPGARWLRVWLAPP